MVVVVVVVGVEGKNRNKLGACQWMIIMIKCFSCNTNNVGVKCQWIVVNFIRNNDWQVEHIRSDEWNCVPCCKVPNGMLCTCGDIIHNDENFRSCQSELLEKFPIIPRK